MHIAKNVNAIFGNKYPLWRVKTGITAVTSAAETTSHGVLRRVESWNSSELGWCPSRSFPLLCEVPRRVKARCTPGPGNISCPPCFSPHLYPPIPPRPFIFDESLGLPPTASFHSRVTPSRPTPTNGSPSRSSSTANDTAKKLNHFSQLRKPSCSSCALVTAKLSPRN